VDHQSALDRNLTERYVLGELEAVESAEFEEHFFECVACAEDIRLASALVASVKAVLREEDAVRVIEIRPGDKFLNLTIGVRDEASLLDLECKIQRGTELAPVVLAVSPSGGSVHLHLPVGLFSPGPCTVVLTDKGSCRELERREFIISKTS
jgi:hypothetical protein